MSGKSSNPKKPSTSAAGSGRNRYDANALVKAVTHYYNTKIASASCANAKAGDVIVISSSDSEDDGATEVQIVAKYMECKICLDACPSPIYSCQNGHLICGLCYDKLARKGVPTCPLKCPGPLTASHFAERLSREIDLVFDCPFKDSGCSTPIKATLLRDHTNICEYRDITCNKHIWNRLCNAIIPMLKYPEHLVSVHKEVICHNGSGSRKFTTEPLIQGHQKSLEYWAGFPHRRNTTVIQFDGHTFILHMARQNRSLHWWFTMLGGAKAAEKYRVETRILQPTTATASDCDFDTMCHLLPVDSYHEHSNFDEFSGSYATISAARLTKFYMEKVKDPEKRMFRISWNFVPVSESPIDMLTLRKRKAENELAEIERKCAVLEHQKAGKFNI